MRRILLLAIFTAFAFACANSATAPEPAAPTPELAASEPAAPAPTAFSDSDYREVRLFQDEQDGRQTYSSLILGSPPPNVDACEIYAQPGVDDVLIDGSFTGRKVVKPGNPEYERHVSALIANLQDTASGTPTPDMESAAAWFADCLARARAME